MEVVAEEQSIYQKKLREFYSHLQKFYPAGHEEKFGYFNLMNRTINLMMNQITQMSLEKHSPDLLIEISIDSCGIFDFFRAEEMVETGRTSAINSLENFGRIKKQA